MVKLNENSNFIKVKNILIIVIGAVLMAFAVNLVFEPMNLVTGGVSGIAIVVKKWTEPFIDGGLPIWVFTLVANGPLFIYTFIVNGPKRVANVLIGTLVFIVALIVIPIFDVQFDDRLLGSIIGGTINGIGIGMVFSRKSSTGGTDLLATLIHDKKRYFSIPQILIVIDGFVVLMGAMVFGIGNALYAIIAIFVSSKVSDGILEGLKFAKMAYIISDNADDIAKEIMIKLDRGVTSIYSKGMYSNQDRNMLICVVSQKEIVDITNISKEIDPKSFIIVSDVREVQGEGFIEYKQ